MTSHPDTAVDVREPSLVEVSRADVVFVPHTHWDREWYEPFQVFRHRLVREMDRLLDSAEADPDFRFTLDGQSAAILDYLEMRPESEDRVRRLAASGRLALGPWLILLDEFLCGGETIVRNLRMGVAAARALGGSMMLGYLPDMFGHVAQMPQILVRAGIGHAALWRGVPGAVEGHSFLWQAPDGSSVRTEYLFDGYDNGFDVLLVPSQIGRALDDYKAMTAGRWGSDPVLAMAGTDHSLPDPRLARWLRGESRPGRSIAIASLDEYVSALAPDPNLARVTGELRSHARGNILPGVLSVRRPLKQLMAQAERVADEAERLAARWSAQSPDEFLSLAWRKIIESSAHDSVVGSGTDETSEQVAARLAEAVQIARAARDGVTEVLARSVPAGSYFAVNPLPFDRTVMAEIEVETGESVAALSAVGADGRPLALQLLDASSTVLSDERVPAADLERVLRRIHRRELFGRQIISYTLEPGVLTFRLAESAGEEPFDLLQLRGEVAAAAVTHPQVWRVLTTTLPVRRALVQVPVQASGLTAFSVTEGVQEQHAPGEATGIGNGLLDVVVKADGTFDLLRDGVVQVAGLGKLVDGGDRGDSYNYGPPATDRLIDEPSSVEVRVLENGPLRWVLEVVREYDVPVGLSSDPDLRSDHTAPLSVRTQAELRAGETFLRLNVSFVNAMEDHRLRLHFPLGETVSHSDSEGQFCVTRRSLVSEGGWGEFPLPTYPASGFVSAGAVTVLLDHATEYEIVSEGTELAVTLLRAVGAMSKNLHPLRDEPAASEIPVPGAQALGENVTGRFAVLTSAQGWPVALGEHFRSEALVRRGSGPANLALPHPQAGLRVEGESVSVTSLHRLASGVEIRIVGMSDAPTTATVAGDFTEVATLNLLGEQIDCGPADGTIEIALNPWEIRTLLVR